MELDPIPFDREQAVFSASLQVVGKPLGLSLADRAYLALDLVRGLLVLAGETAPARVFLQCCPQLDRSAHISHSSLWRSDSSSAVRDRCQPRGGCVPICPARPGLSQHRGEGRPTRECVSAGGYQKPNATGAFFQNTSLSYPAVRTLVSNSDITPYPNPRRSSNRLLNILAKGATQPAMVL